VSKGLVKVIEKQSEEILFTCPVDEIESAYKFCKDMEEIGLDVELVSPSLAETLLRSLGRDEADIEKLKAEMESEIDDHDDSSCTYCLPDTNTKH
jgi:hypothetical protein